MPEEVTVEDVEQLHIDAWRLGLKAIAIYRDNCKVAQPLSTTKKEAPGATSPPAGSEAEAHTRELTERVAELEVALAKSGGKSPTPSSSERCASACRAGACRAPWPSGSRTARATSRSASTRTDGPGEVFIKVSKQGSTLAGIMDAFSISISLGLQHGVPLATYVEKYSAMKFEPAGLTDDPDLRMATSLVDYIFRRLALDYLSYEERLDLGVLSVSERTQPTLPGVEESAHSLGVAGRGPHDVGIGDHANARPSGAARCPVLLQLR